MTVQRMEHVGIVVEDLAAATDFFLELGLELQGGGEAGGSWVDRVIGLEDVRTEIAMLQAPGGGGGVELVKFHSPPAQAGDPGAPPNTRGFRHLSFAVDDVEATVDRLRSRGAELVGEVERYEDSWLLCYVRGPEGILIELAQRLG